MEIANSPKKPVPGHSRPDCKGLEARVLRLEKLVESLTEELSEVRGKVNDDPDMPAIGEVYT